MTENVYGEVRNSHPVPQIITTQGDGYVGNDNLPDLIDLFWHKILGGFSRTTNLKLEQPQELFKDEFFEVVGMFEQAYKLFTG